MQVTLKEALDRARESTQDFVFEYEAPVDDSLDRASIPMKFQRIEPNETYTTHLVQGKNLYITGHVGAGKTHLVCAILKAWLALGEQFYESNHSWNRFYSCRFVSSLRLLNELKDTYSSNTEREKDVMHKYVDTGLLAIDDFGKECPTEWALSKLFELLDERYLAMRPTIVTTQYSTEALVQHLARGGNEETAKAIVSRLLYRAEVIQLAGGDRRR